MNTKQLFMRNIATGGVSRTENASENRFKNATKERERKEKDLPPPKKKKVYKDKPERQFQYDQTKDKWKGVTSITGIKKSGSERTVGDPKDFANKLNPFYTRFLQPDDCLDSVKTELQNTGEDG